LVERDDLAVDHRVVRELRQRGDDARITAAEVLVVPRPQVERTLALEGDGAVAVQLEFKQPLVTGGKASVRSISMGSMNRADERGNWPVRTGARRFLFG
jgi:hypothetical protein